MADDVEVRGVVDEETEDLPRPVVVRPEPERVLASWKGPSRLYKERNREFWVTVFTMGGVVGMVLFFVEGWMPVAVLVAFIFFLYVMSTVPPDNVEYRITNKGIFYGEKTYRWGSMFRFWIEEKWGKKIVWIDIFGIPGRIHLILSDEVNEEVVKEVMKTYLIEEKPKEGWVDKVTGWVNKKVPIE